MSELQKIAIISTPSLEFWDHTNPAKGIGGSETSHVRAAQLLHQRGYDVTSFAPIPEDCPPDPTGLAWRNSKEFDAAAFKVVIDYRDLKLFDVDKPEGSKWWLIAQDVAYEHDATPERLAKIDRYVSLCPTHAAYTKSRYPDLHNTGRLFVSSNGIEAARIRDSVSGITRNPKRLMYASSPDRGLMLLLENWFRIRERVPDAELHVFYGFHNMEVIVGLNGETDWRFAYQRELTELLKQPGVVWHDRVGQQELWRNWAESNIWFYPTDFPETSCITSMEAQACGVIPVVTNFWALKSNIVDGYKFDGFPQKSDVIRGLMIEKVVKLLNDSSDWDAMSADFDDDGNEFDGLSRRAEMQEAAQKRFDWGQIANQWEGWIREDLGLPPLPPPEVPAHLRPKTWEERMVVWDAWAKSGYGSACITL